MRDFRASTLCVVFILVNLAVSVRAQTPLYGQVGSSMVSRMGTRLASAGDFDSDGVTDFMVSSFDASGTFWLYSGATGATLRSITAPRGVQSFGTSLANVGDIDGDGVLDQAAGSPSCSITGVASGAAVLYSGATGSIIRYHVGVAQDGLGSGICGVGDIDGDGFGDYGLSAIGSYSAPVAPGRVEVRSGATGAILWSVASATMTDRFGMHLLDVGDMDGDGIDDLMTSAIFEANDDGRVVILSGATGAVIHDIAGTSGAGGRAGTSVGGGGDVDRDGVPDFIYGEPNWSLSGSSLDGRVVVCSGATGAVLHSIAGTTNERLGVSSGIVGDVNGDGFDDFYAGLRINFPVGQSRYFIYSGRDGSVLGTAPVMSGDGSQMSMIGLGDLDGDGFGDILFADEGYDLPNRFDCGRFWVEASATQPTLVYDGSAKNHALFLEWAPAGSMPGSLLGDVVGQGAAPNAAGFHIESLAEARLPVLGIELLTAVDTTNLIDAGSFTFDALGEHRVSNVSRSHPYIAGWNVHVQWFEVGATIRSSNGLRLLMEP